jgi:copper chaperone NosL
MRPVFERSARFLHEPVGFGPRACLVAAALLLSFTYLVPLWNLTMFAPQYPHGLQLDIYSHTLVAGHGGEDIQEINLLNHYIGMHELAIDDFTEFKWLPFALGALALLFLRAAVLGTMKELVDAAVLFLYFSAFSLWTFGYRLYRYGHDLAPTAAVKVPGFTPPIFGHQKIANFEVYSYPKAGSYLLGAVVLLLVAALWMAWRGRTRTA